MTKIILGKICSSHGILGWMKIFSYTEKKKKIFQYNPLYYEIGNKKNKLKIQDWKCQKNFFLIRVKNIINRSASDLLKNIKIFIYHTQLKHIKNVYYWYELINFEVFNTQKKFLGTVKNIIRTPSNDILIINKKKNYQNKEILIPFIEKKIIKKIKRKKKKILINWNI
ncbi:ribosome maturation factor RimM [Buchnera aphidicola]|uniref:ribosome maturation factor RimM n=1 Tax=Buchnera aphidicola TaxID=9 RepID=UPI0020921A45|nr:ribosome maturation factor RimM [Buchnera aphidicola]USS94385.1 ribosome maturation factor RimM [Buchnera aphidicola (Sipha maydis)]WII23546.1 ribosome maturation factor RimM [Buchnera aphidicola (Sipha maydis)]